MRYAAPIVAALALVAAACGQKDEEIPVPPSQTTPSTQGMQTPSTSGGTETPAPTGGSSTELPRPGQNNDHSSPAFQGEGASMPQTQK
jgi:hypothetical protein